jgi:signal peptidase II
MAKQMAMARVRRIPFPYVLGLLILAADLISKYAVSIKLPLTSGASYWYPYGGIGVFENYYGIEFSINHVTNRGAAWGLFSDFQDILFWSRLLLVGGLIGYLLFFNKRSDRQIPLILIAAGALGNIFDIFIYGHVIDMFHFVFWGFDYPVFNVADASICIGIGWLMVNSWLTDQ